MWRLYMPAQLQCSLASTKVWQTNKNCKYSHCVSLWSPWNPTKKFTWKSHESYILIEKKLDSFQLCFIFCLLLIYIFSWSFPVTRCIWNRSLICHKHNFLQYSHDLMKTRKMIEGSNFKKILIDDILLQTWFLVKKPEVIQFWNIWAAVQANYAPPKFNSYVVWVQ